MAARDKRKLLEAPFLKPNRLKEAREERLLSKAELARRAAISPLTIDRIEKGNDCRPETKRKILLALGLKISDRKQVF
jgi:DNA-binding XRE family transcriptional regulator